ncbi:hypothetical protein Q3A66_00375 [Hymenobacter sp. BT770]|uniref:hypothetical protein n=1 Tax=Hymenobacter sp. BT770 TaxID=2886942 RepID=UPI001D1118FF|nr:hypothetical protein [Hymenobacter sp. BT770]MCC3151876.1 hypothetical protein [Hymenobacter sp. BT770]MDO3413502.1 hypothetical protein [Hymenobacter sp. BT770]
MKRTLFSLLFVVGIATTASAQAGWGSSDSWGSPKKSAAKKATTGGQNRATGNEKTPQNDGRTVSPYPSGPAKPDANPGNTASTPPDNSFIPGTTSSSTQGGNDRQGMSAAPGTPVMLQSGRNVMANDAAAARERRLNHMNKLSGRPAAVPTQVDGSAINAGQSSGAGAVPAAEAGTAPAPNAGAMSPAGGAAGTGAALKATPPKKAAPISAPKKKAAPAPAGW